MFRWLVVRYEEGPIKTWNLLIKNCVFILTCFNLSHLQSALHLMQYTYQDFFPTAQNSFWTWWSCCHLVLLPFFVSPPPHWLDVSLWGRFSSGGTKKEITGRGNGVNRKGGARRLCHVYSKLLNTQCGVGRRAPNSPIVKWAKALKES